MDLVGSIQYLGDRLGGRKPNQNRGKPVQKNSRNEATADKVNPPVESTHPSAESDTRLGSKIDTIA